MVVKPGHTLPEVRNGDISHRKRFVFLKQFKKKQKGNRNVIEENLCVLNSNQKERTLNRCP